MNVPQGVSKVSTGTASAAARLGPQNIGVLVARMPLHHKRSIASVVQLAFSAKGPTKLRLASNRGGKGRSTFLAGDQVLLPLVPLASKLRNERANWERSTVNSCQDLGPRPTTREGDSDSTSKCDQWIHKQVQVTSLAIPPPACTHTLYTHQSHMQ